MDAIAQIRAWLCLVLVLLSVMMVSPAVGIGWYGCCCEF